MQRWNPGLNQTCTIRAWTARRHRLSVRPPSLHRSLFYPIVSLRLLKLYKMQRVASFDILEADWSIGYDEQL